MELEKLNLGLIRFVANCEEKTTINSMEELDDFKIIEDNPISVKMVADDYDKYRNDDSGVFRQNLYESLPDAPRRVFFAINLSYSTNDMREVTLKRAESILSTIMYGIDNILEKFIPRPNPSTAFNIRLFTYGLTEYMYVIVLRDYYVDNWKFNIVIAKELEQYLTDEKKCFIKNVMPNTYRPGTSIPFLWSQSTRLITVWNDIVGNRTYQCDDRLQQLYNSIISFVPAKAQKIGEEYINTDISPMEEMLRIRDIVTGSENIKKRMRKYAMVENNFNADAKSIARLYSETKESRELIRKLFIESWYCEARRNPIHLLLEQLKMFFVLNDILGITSSQNALIVQADHGISLRALERASRYTSRLKDLFPAIKSRYDMIMPDTLTDTFKTISDSYRFWNGSELIFTGGMIEKTASNGINQIVEKVIFMIISEFVPLQVLEEKYGEYKKNFAAIWGLSQHLTYEQILTCGRHYFTQYIHRIHSLLEHVDRKSKVFLQSVFTLWVKLMCIRTATNYDRENCNFKWFYEDFQPLMRYAEHFWIPIMECIRSVYEERPVRGLEMAKTQDAREFKVTTGLLKIIFKSYDGSKIKTNRIYPYGLIILKTSIPFRRILVQNLSNPELAL